MEYPITCDELRSLSRSDAAEFYKKWGQQAGIWAIMDVDPYLCEVLFDTSVLFGHGRAIRWMQLEAGAEDDGIIGPETIACCSAYGPQKIARRIIARRIVYHTNKVSREPKQTVFLAGWMNRCVDLLRLV